MKKTGIYPGTFDPITNGHIELVRRGLKIFDEIIVAVTTAQKKHPLFTIEERLKLIKGTFDDWENVAVDLFDGLLVDYVRSKNGTGVIRGLRAVSDFEYEFQMALMNRRLDINIETVFMMPSEQYTFLTSTIIKEVASFGGSVENFVPQIVEKALKEKFKK